MSLKVALFSGGKESVYAATKRWPLDIFLTFVYEFPRPSPHLVNLAQVIEVGGAIGLPVLVLKLKKGKEPEQQVRLLRKMGVGELVAGDVYVEDHLNYLEKVSKEAGVELREPLWGMETEKLLRDEIREGQRPMIVGIEDKMNKWIGKILSPENLEEFILDAKEAGIDPLGEKGEYHSLVTNSPIHKYELKFEIEEILNLEGYKIIRLRNR